MANSLNALRKAGVPVDQMNAEQQRVLTGLSDAETEVLIKFHQSLTAAAGEVEGQGNCYLC